MAEDKLGQAAKELGAEDGKAKGSFVIGLHLNTAAAKAILEGYEAGDEGVLDLCPKPLAGEWADDPTPMRLLDEIANKADIKVDKYTTSEEIEHDLLDTYEEAFREAFWAECTKLCREMLP